jgi:glycosyltransferase involved in cell wall biosynthesis
VALFACAYNEIDGVANTCRRFEEFAKRHELPLLSVHGGAGQYRQSDGSVTRLEFQRQWPKFSLDKKHDYDLYFWRYYRAVEAAVRDFNPDVVHVTGPSDVGQMGALIAHRRRIPLVASWHTNVHEYAERRFVNIARVVPEPARQAIGGTIRKWSFSICARFYRIARLLFAPNPELVEQLERSTGKPCRIMSRGVDTNLFRPERRDSAGAPPTIGYVGRFTAEKNVRLLQKLEQTLFDRGQRNFRLLMVGQGAEEPWLRANLQNAEFTGVLQGEALARAYANMDVFAFPSRTDTFGNVVLEALASGVPAVVTDAGGPKFIILEGQDGFVTQNDSEFVDRISSLLSHPAPLAAMRATARAHALEASWDAVFEHVYQCYNQMIEQSQTLVPCTPGMVTLN